MKQRTSQILYAYWNDVRRGRTAPRRLEIEPSRLTTVLPETLILERANSEAYVFRLAGTRICEQFREELRGANFLDCWSPTDRFALAARLAGAAEYGAVVVALFEASTADLKKVAFEIVLLPLVHSGARIDRFLGAISAVNPPPWLGTERLAHRRLLRHELIWPDGRPAAKRPLDLAAAAGRPRLVQTGRHTLRVYDGGQGRTTTEDA